MIPLLGSGQMHHPEITRKIFHSLTYDEAQSTLASLNPSKFNYKVDKDDDYLGFIAEDVPDLVATKDRKGLSPMDIVAVLTKVVQKQQEEIEALKNLFATKK